MTTFTMERPQVRQSSRPLPGGHDELAALEESLSLDRLRQKLGGLGFLTRGGPPGSAPKSADHEEDTWDEPESELTRALNRALQANPERFVMSESLKRIQSHALRNPESD